MHGVVEVINAAESEILSYTLFSAHIYQLLPLWCLTQGDNHSINDRIFSQTMNNTT